MIGAVHDDVQTLTAELIRERCGRLPSVIVGSPPCQDASTANARGKGVDGERTGLFFDAIRLVNECRPVWACFENVAGIRTRGADRVCAALEAIGYTVWPLVVGAWHAGAPHKRNRVWFVAVGSHADEGVQLQQREHEEARRSVGEFADAHSPRLAIGEGERGDAFAQLPPAIRTIAEKSSWNGGAGGLAGSLRVVDGLPGGVARQCIAAYGDAVVPAITEAIGRTMMRLLPTDGAILDLFCGVAGGWSLGMHRAGYHTIAACEIDPWRREVFKRHMELLVREGCQ